MKFLVRCGAIALLGVISLTASAQLSKQDREFVLKAAQGGLFEVQANQMGVNRSRNAEIKQASRRMVKDHTAANNELKALARNKGIVLPTQTDAKHRAILSRLQRLSGMQFDREHVTSQLKAHQETIALFKKQAKHGKDKDLVAWARGLIMDLETHHDIWGRAAHTLGIHH
jgi:putative membrane protein